LFSVLIDIKFETKVKLYIFMQLTGHDTCILMHILPISYKSEFKKHFFDLLIYIYMWVNTENAA